MHILILVLKTSMIIIKIQDFRLPYDGQYCNSINDKTVKHISTQSNLVRLKYFVKTMSTESISSRKVQLNEFHQ